MPPLSFDAQGLLTVVAQDHRTGEVRMVAHANREALEATLRTRRATFFSRSRGRLWVKGEESGNVLEVREVWLDCDADCAVYLVEPAGPSCHTGAESCFFVRLDGEGGGRALPVLARLERELEARRDASAERSYTKSLLEQGAPKIGAKLREEAGELADALERESDARVVSELADVLYHAMVGLVHRGVPLASVEAELARRFGVSGHEEKASR
ncbi:MAG: bifunctional phosphoribosyl-AMP cyclohydrolase/phosphoribosyl-ATP diphosphatase HisIE [Sandaracinaceae bacterium]|nr:bifunctional phosphoribosyl-AMP cyclohydrolase/phosphoribosyl-ATP diphosphatase HisIE [Sandaracinaceae bacterium]